MVTAHNGLQDYEPIWHERDAKVRRFCEEEGVDTIERGSHTLWDPRKVIETNGGVPPLTYQMFLVNIIQCFVSHNNSSVVENFRE